MAAFQKAIDATDRTTSLSFTDSSQPIQIAVGDLSGVSVSVSGTWTGAISFEGSVSGTTWSAIKVYLLSNNSESATITATGQYGINPTPFSQIRIVPAVASGSVLVELLAVKTSSFNWLSAIWKLISDRIPALSNGKIPVEVASLPLPTNAATSVLQATANTSLASIDTKTPALGQALAASSTPVVLPAAQITALTPPTTVGVNSLPALSTGSNAIGSITNTSFGISGTLPAFTNTPTFNIGTAPNLTFTNTSFTANAGNNLNTSALALESGGNLAGINFKLPSNLTVSASRLLVDGSQVIQPVSMAAAPAGSAYESTATITRAANTTAYTASDPNFDVYGGLFELQNIGQAGKGIFLSFFEISLNLSAVPSGMTSFTVYLYRTAPTNIADNSIWTIGSDPPLDSLGFNVSMSRAKGGGKVAGNIKDLNQLFVLSSTSLWGYIVTNGAFTPAANSETGTIRARSFAP